jgi:biopolymer transport protein TolR
VKKDLNFDLNIMPILDILSVLITFLLLTAVWVDLSSVDMKQAVGDNSLSGATNPPSIWAEVSKDGNVRFSLRDIKEKMKLEYNVAGSAGAIDWKNVSSTIQMVKAKLPDLKTGIIRPEAHTNYGEVIQLMDQMKKQNITDLGLSPLG